jgi:hypothetical protein
MLSVARARSRPSGTEDNNPDTYCLLGPADAGDEWHGRCCILLSATVKRTYSVNEVVRLAMQCQKGQEAVPSEG